MTHENNKKHKKNNFPLIFLISLIALAFFLFPLISLAEYKTEIGLPSLPQGTTIKNPGQYIQGLLTFGLYLLSFLAVGFIAVGGIMWIVAAGNPSRIDKAKEMIIGAISGLVLLLCSWLILNTIDPSLTNINAPDVQQLQNNVTNPVDSQFGGYW